MCVCVCACVRGCVGGCEIERENVFLNVGKQDRIVRSIHCITLDCYKCALILCLSLSHYQFLSILSHIHLVLMLCMHFVAYCVCLPLYKQNFVFYLYT